MTGYKTHSASVSPAFLISLVLLMVVWDHTHPIRFEGEMAEMILQDGFETFVPLAADPMIFDTPTKIVIEIAS